MATKTFRRGDDIVWTTAQGGRVPDHIVRVVLIPGYDDPKRIERWYVLRDLGLTVHDSMIEWPTA